MSAKINHSIGREYKDKIIYMNTSHYGLHGRELERRRKLANRRREVRKHIMLLILGIILVIGLSLSYHVIRSQANTETSEIEYKYYKSIVLEPGDTLWAIAEENAGIHYQDLKSYIKEVMIINHLNTEEISAGDYLVIPYYSSELIGIVATR